MQKPYIALRSIACTYARQEKRQYVLVYFLFILANLAAAMRLLLLCWFIVDLLRYVIDSLNLFG